MKGDQWSSPTEEIDVRFDDTEFLVGDNDIDLMVGNDDGGTRTAKPLLLPPNQVVPEPDSGCYVYRVSVPVSRVPKARATVEAVDFTSVPLLRPAPAATATATPGVDYSASPPRLLTYPPGAASPPCR